ncbi:adenosylcobinamide-GDP ribazoletransferase [Propionicicella superfundia]|uniref:adenosylcobinamide-GDP ribazoletransferase n=1 Tax=Propionicicella superfundia TaxID=348582 RepID=UPI000402535B|nr:adenosylcobinamide-GDP ribazoletransferase [Propionicicella superfundia]
MIALVPGARLALGTVTAIPVPPPDRVDEDVARTAMLLAPFAVLPVALVASGASAGLAALGVPRLAAGLVCIALLALGTRAIHLDGLADTCDALGVPGDRDRALEVMKRGDVGPMGAGALVLVLGLQAACLGDLLAHPWGWAIAAAGLAASRCALALGCTPLVPAARPGGLGKAVAGSVPVWAAVVSGALWAGLVALLTLPGWGALAVLAALGAVVGLLSVAVRRFGGMTGDVLGAAVELAAAVVLLGLTVV